jgi:membrane-associated phospholipid phosphatase
MVKKMAVGIALFSITLCGISAHAAAPDEAATARGTAVLEAPLDFESHQEQPQAGTDTPNLKYFRSYVTDTGKIVASPLHWESKDWIKAGLVLGATSTLFLADKKIRDFALDNQSKVASRFASVGNDLGNGMYTLPAVGGFYLYGYLADDHKAKRASLLALESFTLSGALTSGIKVLAERHRPNTGHDPQNWDGPSLSVKNVSFSSGHAASAFSIATVFAEEYKDNRFVPPIAYGLATLTGLSRIYSNAHWSSDVFLGAAIGYFMSKAVLKLHKDDPKHAAHRLTVLPSISKEMTGLNMKYDF